MWIIYSTATGAQIGDFVEAEPVTVEPGQAYALAPESARSGVSVWSPAVHGFIDAPPAPPEPPRRPVCINFHADAGATLTLTNLASAAGFLAGSNRSIEKMDLSLFTQARLIVRVMVVGSATSILSARWRDAFSTNIADYQPLGDAEVAAPLNVAPFGDSGWIDIAGAALGDNRFVAIRQSGGDGIADPQIGRVSLWLR